VSNKKKTAGSITECLQNEPPFCTVACPFHLDVRDFIDKLKRGGFQAAYRAYGNAVGFPAIVAALCDEPCRGVCPRKDSGGAIDMRRLEQAAIDNARSLDPNSYNVPPKHKSIAIIGAGPSGLACALRLAARGYAVTVFEKTGRIGGHLYDVLDPGIFLPEIERQFKHVEYELRLNTEVQSLDDLAFDAIYVATGKGGPDFGLTPSGAGAFASTKPGVFIGGSLVGANSMRAIADGLQASTAIERWIKTGGMNQPREAGGTKLEIDVARIPPVEPVPPADGRTYAREDAVVEAARCLQCTCDVCFRACDLMHYFEKFPKRIADEVEITIHPGTLDGNGTVATRLISTCNQCGLCKEVCPKGIDTGDLLLKSHRIMRAKGAMPWAFHEFFLRDMAAANGEAWLSRMPPGHERCRYMFFPGCQLGASDPRYVAESYRFLLGVRPDTALTLGCCGAPAEWAGDEPVRDAVTEKIRRSWIAFGRPVVVFACPTCRQIFGRHLPEIEGVFLYDLMREQGLNPPVRADGEIVSVFDPCSSREEPGVQDSVRELARRAGFRLEPLPMEGRFARCCSWGGQVSIAYPPYARAVVKDRIEENDRPYLAYCANCRDIFAAAGKPVRHILDVMLGLNGPDRRPPTVTGRRRNRMILKRRVLAEWWNEPGEPEERRMTLHIAPELARKLSDDMILETDIEAVIAFCERTGRKVCDPATGNFSGHLQIGPMTFWAEYRPAAGGGFELVNAYGHRMSIEEV